MNLSDMYNELKDFEKKAAKMRADLIEAMQDKRHAAPKGYTGKIKKKVPKYDTPTGGAHLNHALKGRALDPDVLAALDEIVPDNESDNTPISE